MEFLLDTHSFLWFLQGNENLSVIAREKIENEANKLYLSIASIWEITIKLNLGKLKLDVSLEDLKHEIYKNDIELLAIDFEHIIRLNQLENHHRDPFDRIIISQCIFENLTILSKDNNFLLYREVKVIW